MSKAELQRNLGRIGFSGTSEFVKVLEDKAKSNKCELLCFRFN